MEESLRRRHRHRRRHLAAAPGLAEDRDVSRIAAERRDVLLDPAERGDDVEHADVAGVGPLLAAAEIRQVEEPEQVQPVVDRHDDDVFLAREIGAVVEQPVAGAAAEPAAVEPHHHRPIARAEAWREDVDAQTVFAHFLAAIERPDFGDGAAAVVRRALGDLHRIAHARPRRGLHRRHEPIRAGGRRAVRHAEELVDTEAHQAADFSRARLDDGRHRQAASVLRAARGQRRRCASAAAAKAPRPMNERRSIAARLSPPISLHRALRQCVERPSVVEPPRSPRKIPCRPRSPWWLSMVGYCNPEAPRLR